MQSAARHLLSASTLGWLLAISLLWAMQRQLGCDCASEPGWLGELRSGARIAALCALMLGCMLLCAASLEAVLERRSVPAWLRVPLRLLALLAGALLGQLLRAQWISPAPGREPAPVPTLQLYLTGSIMWVLIGALGLGVLLLQRRQQQSQAVLAEAQARHLALRDMHLQAQLNALHAQIEPHFLFNTLANVRRLYEVAPAQGRLMLGALIDYLRHVLPGIRRPHSSLGEELELVRSYLQIQQLRMGERLAYRISADPSLLELMLPPLMLATLVENAIKHGLAPLPRGGCVEISATRRDAALEIEVRDDGRGFGGDSAGTGTGLANCHARLQALYGDRAWLRLEAIAPQGVRACLHLPAEAAHTDEAIA